MAGNSRVSDQTCPTLELLSVRTISTVTAPATPAAKPLRPIGTPFCRHLPAASVFQPVIGPSQIVRVRMMVTFRNWLLRVKVDGERLQNPSTRGKLEESYPLAGPLVVRLGGSAP
jgi:hypothetical protein